MGVGLIICRVGCNDGSCKFCSQNLYRGTRLGCLNGSYGPASGLKNRTFGFCDYFVILSHRMKSMDAVEAILGVHVDTSYINMCANFE